MHRLAVLSIAALAAVAPAAAQEMKTFRDWSGFCDNLRACSAFGLKSDGDAQAFIRISREGGPDARPHVLISAYVEGAKPGTKVKLAFDDPALPGLPREALPADVADDTLRLELKPETAAAFIAALRRARTLFVEPVPRSADGPGRLSLSLSGSVATLVWLDEQQGRVGTPAALAARGDKPAAAAPLPALPVVTAKRPAGGPLPKKVPAAVLAQVGPDCDPESRKAEPIVARLDARRLLWGVRCELAAYNVTYAFFVADDGQPPRPATLPLPAALQSEQTGNVLINPAFDAATMTLSFFAKARGLGDCGTAGSWVWDGEAFRLIAFSTMPECRGVPPDDWPVLYRATVK